MRTAIAETADRPDIYTASARGTAVSIEDSSFSFSASLEPLPAPVLPEFINCTTVSAAYPNFPLPSFNPALLRLSFALLKPCIDILLVLLAAPLWVPLCLLAGLCIWLEDGAGPMFFQQRIGRNGKQFTIWKFRTMVPNAAEVLRCTLAENAAVRHAWDEQYKLKDDPRITTVGRWLRRYSIDELPQLVNVLLGHMSLIGPRPLPVYHHSQLSETARAMRELVKPGLTGLWQISGRSDIGNRGMELWDPFYVRNWSLWLDCTIFLRTFKVVSRGTGAY